MCVFAFCYCVSIVYLHRAFILDFRGYSWSYSTVDGDVLASLDTFADPILEALHPSTRSLLVHTDSWMASALALLLVDCMLLVYATYSIAMSGTFLYSRIILGVSYAVVLSCATYMPAPADAVLPLTSHLRTCMMIDPITVVRMLIFMDARERFDADGVKTVLMVYGMTLLSLYSLVARVCYTNSIVMGIALAYVSHHTADDIVIILYDTMALIRDSLRFAMSSCCQSCRGGNKQTTEYEEDKQQLRGDDHCRDSELELVDGMDDTKNEVA